MADFITAYNKTSGHEGGYANHKLDNGGETYKGIARNYWGSWGGWKYLDSVKKVNSSAGYINKALAANQTVQALVHEFYKTNFWYPLNLGAITDQKLANNVYDFAVNAGVGASAKRFQKAANQSGASLQVDGQIGPKSIAVINKLNAQTVYRNFNLERKGYYDNIIAKNPSQAVFKGSWYSRIIPYDKA